MSIKQEHINALLSNLNFKGMFVSEIAETVKRIPIILKIAINSLILRLQR